MKIVGSILISNRLAESCSAPRRRAQRSSLTLGKKPGTEDEPCIVHQTAENKIGTKYKVRNNIEKVFEKYMKEGKATIRFKEPPHDLIISCDPKSLENFLKTLNLVLRNKIPTKSLRLSTVCPLKQVPPKPKTCVTVLTKEEYPFLEGFPPMSVKITINGIEQSRFDMRLLGLPHLKVLDLRNNHLTSVPRELELLSNLNTLILAQNHMGKSFSADWLWMRSESLAKSLEELDLSQNELVMLPAYLCRLRALKILRLSQNKLQALPNGLGTLSCLKHLSAANNCLEHVPGSAVLLRLWVLDLSANPFCFRLPELDSEHVGAPSLLECAARKIVDERLVYYEDELPRSLQIYLDSANFCFCGRACFETHAKANMQLDLSSISQSVVRSFSELGSVPLESVLCSKQCVTNFKNSRNS